MHHGNGPRWPPSISHDPDGCRDASGCHGRRHRCRHWSHDAWSESCRSWSNLCRCGQRGITGDQCLYPKSGRRGRPAPAVQLSTAAIWESATLHSHIRRRLCSGQPQLCAATRRHLHFFLSGGKAALPPTSQRQLHAGALKRCAGIKISLERFPTEARKSHPVATQAMKPLQGNKRNGRLYPAGS